MLSEDLFVDVVEPAATRKKRLSFAPTLASIVAYSIRAPPVDVGACAIQTCVKDSEDSDTADSTSLWDLKTRHWSDSTTLLTNRDSSDTNNNVFLSSLAFYPQDSYIRGQAMVRNLAFEKTLSVRYSLDDWLSFEDVKGIFVGPVSSHRWTSPSAAHKASDITKDLSTSPSWDLFEFAIPLPLLHSHTSVKLDTRRQSSRPRVKATLSFCLQYTVGGQEFWDNHHGKDYKVGRH